LSRSNTHFLNIPQTSLVPLHKTYRLLTLTCVLPSLICILSIHVSILVYLRSSLTCIAEFIKLVSHRCSMSELAVITFSALQRAHAASRRPLVAGWLNGWVMECSERRLAGPDQEFKDASNRLFPSLHCGPTMALLRILSIRRTHPESSVTSGVTTALLVLVSRLKAAQGKPFPVISPRPVKRSLVRLRISLTCASCACFSQMVTAKSALITKHLLSLKMLLYRATSPLCPTGFHYTVK
jgi:hypothetical protein